jgi:hypothetical protein
MKRRVSVMHGHNGGVKLQFENKVELRAQLLLYKRFIYIQN